MKNLKVILPGLSLIICLGLVFSACRHRGYEPSTKVQLGAVFSLSGNISDLGIPSANGAKLAIAELNKSGEVLGRKVELLLKDGESDTATTRQRVAEILKEAPGTAAFFGLSDTDLALAAAEEASSKNRVFLTSGATSPLLPGQVPGYLYLACFGDNVQAAAAAEWIYNELKARTVSIVFDSTDTYTILLQRYFMERFQSLGGQVLGVQGYDPANISQAVNGMPQADFVFLSAHSAPDAVELIGQMREEGITTPVVGGDGYDADNVWEAHPEITNVFYTTHVYLGEDNTDQLVKNFRDAYINAYGGSLPSAFAALGYDAANLLALAITRAGSTDPGAVRSALASIDNFQGVTGTISFAGGRQIPRKTVTIVEVKEGVRTFKSQLMPEVIPDP